MTDSNIIDKKNTIVMYIKERGFLYYFFKNFIKISNGNINNLKNLWIEITKLQYKKNWIIIKEQLCYKIDEDLYYNINTLTFNGNNIENLDFFDIFGKNYAIMLNYINIQNYINVTKDEYKSSWIIDKTKSIIYFKFRNLCGEGSMKKTYLGWNIINNKPIVVYQINVPTNQIEQKRYLNEKKIGELKKSENLLQIYYSFAQREYQKVYMISDYIKYSIKNLIDQNYIWNENDYKLFSKQILNGLKYLHELNIIHRDIKPSNILYDVEKKIYKIIDFGIATKYNVISNNIETINHYKTNEELSLVGTVGYIAPEMYKSIYNYNHKNKYNHKVDIFSFGIVLLEMITKQRAFIYDMEEIIENVQSDLEYTENNLKKLINEDYEYLKKINIETDVNRNKKYEKIKIEIQEKMELIQQIDNCEIEEKNSLISELNDKNKSIIICCKKLTNEPKFNLLDKKTNEEHSLILQIKDLQNFIHKLKNYINKSIEDKINDLLIYPLLFMSTKYKYPKLIKEIENEEMRHFIQCCLKKDPEERSDLNELINHKWLK
jgi:serine/threonine protein kinase